METVAIRKGEITDNKLNTVILLAQSVVENSGNAQNGLLQSFYSQGYNEAALVELMGIGCS